MPELELEDGFTKIEPIEPIVVPAHDEEQYTQYWITNMRVNANNPNGKILFVATLKPMLRVDGVAKLLDKPIQISIDDLFAEASKDMDLAVALNYVFEALNKRIKTII